MSTYCKGLNCVPPNPRVETLIPIVTLPEDRPLGRRHCYAVAQLCLTLCNPSDCSPQAPLSMGFFRQESLEWVAISFSRGSS